MTILMKGQVTQEKVPKTRGRARLSLGSPNNLHLSVLACSKESLRARLPCSRIVIQLQPLLPATQGAAPLVLPKCIIVTVPYQRMIKLKNKMKSTIEQRFLQTTSPTSNKFRVPAWSSPLQDTLKKTPPIKHFQTWWLDKLRTAPFKIESPRIYRTCWMAKPAVYLPRAIAISQTHIKMFPRI